MAKLKAPLLSLGASGQLAKTLVFFGWKGINAVREHVIPSNPKTALQTVQRAYVTAAVAAIHTVQAMAGTPLTSVDQVAYSALASAKGKIMTWFNQVVKLWIDVKVAGLIPYVYSSWNMGDKSADSINMDLYSHGETPGTLAAGKMYFGTSKTNLVHSQAMSVESDTLLRIEDVDLSAFLTAGTKYYCQFRPDVADGAEGSDSGIYNFVAE